MAEIRIYEEGIEQYPKPRIIFGNLMMILWIALGTVACWYFNPVIAWIYLAFALIMSFVILRKLVCTNCYYYDKWCTIGWGKLSSLLFRKGDINKFSTCPGVKIAPAVYGSLSLIPLILIIVSLFQRFTILKLIVLILLFSVSFYSEAISRKKACVNCKMRLICPGCAVK
jgi:hypothetical protein